MISTPRPLLTSLLVVSVLAVSCSGGGSAVSSSPAASPTTNSAPQQSPGTSGGGVTTTSPDSNRSSPSTTLAPPSTTGASPPPEPTDSETRLVTESFDSPGTGTWDPADFEAEAGGSGSVEVQFDAGWMTIDPEGSSEWARAASLASSDTDAELIVSLTSRGSGFGSAFIGLRTDGEWQDAVPYMPHRGLVVEYEFTPGTGGGLTLYELSGGATTILATGIGPELPEAETVWIRFQVVGTTARLRVWHDGSPEPDTWTLESPVILAVDGFLTLALRDDPGAAVSWDDLVLYGDSEAQVG